MVPDDKVINRHDFVNINNVFLDGNGEVSTQKNSVPFLQVQQEYTRGILLNRRMYQQLQQGREQFKAEYMFSTRKTLIGNGSA